MDRFVQLTCWGNPAVRLNCQYGEKVLWDEYLELEKLRIEKDPARVAEIRTKGTKSALFVNAVPDFS